MKQNQRLILIKGVFAVAILISTVRFLILNNDVKKQVKIIESTEVGVYSNTFSVMGTFAKVKFCGTQTQTELAAKTVIKKFDLINEHLNTFNKKSELSRLNATAYTKPFKCSPLLWDILQKCRTAYEFSDHTFDVTAKPLMNLWGFYRKRPTPSLPSKAEVNFALSKVGFDKIIFNDKERTVKFSVKEMAIDLGGIAKGYAVDLAVNTLLEQKIIDNGIINLGGNLRILPNTVKKLGNNFPVKIGITNPFQNDTTCGFVELKTASVATSGNYERFLKIDGKKYGHIMNPVTGEPVSDICGVSVVTTSATDADWMSTTVFINGEKSAEKILNQYPNTAILIIKKNNAIKFSNITTKEKDFWDNIKF
ncbi:FAD:protein FMN transferase [Lentisphaerota bacterium WC36G]|nr:FAD:protein FMN transferase [Lentisphaerae bacterium WC36]